MKELKFDWDQWNLQKNEIKHGVSSLEAESMFFDDKLKIFEDLKHSNAKEKRFVAFGESNENRILMAGFTMRRFCLRIITARPASKKERNLYAKEIKRDS